MNVKVDVELELELELGLELKERLEVKNCFFPNAS